MSTEMPNMGKEKSFWQRPEGITGLLFLAALVAGAGYLLSTVNWGLIFANTLYLAGTLAAIGVVAYMVLDPKDTPLKVGQIIHEDEYQESLKEFGYDGFEVGIGGEVIRKILGTLDVTELAMQLRVDMKAATSEAARKKLHGPLS